MEMPSRVKEAIAELARDAVSRQFRQPITTAQAARHVDAELQAEWIGTAIAVQSPHSVITEFLIETMTDAEAVSFLAAASLSFSSSAQHEYVGKHVADRLRAYIANDLRRAAELAADKLERDGPVDEEIFAAYYSDELPALRVVMS
jgi:hypothetical protein